MSRFASSLMLLAVIGCADPPAALVGAADAGVPSESGPPATAMATALQAVGLDPARLPPFDALDEAQRSAVMDTFTRALGLGCGDCHEADYAVATPRTRVARKMWDRLVRALVRRDGGALYCDSCHGGRATFLARGDATVGAALGDWMRASYVTPLLRRDGAPHGCATCHGEPFVGGFLDDWAADDDDTPDAGATTMPPRDLAPPAIESGDLGDRGDLGVVGCEALIMCIDGCSGDGSCTGSCKRRASASARALLAAAEACANDACIAARRCRSASDDSAACNACFSNASAGGSTGVACVPPDDAICGACAAAWAACETS